MSGVELCKIFYRPENLNLIVATLYKQLTVTVGKLVGIDVADARSKSVCLVEDISTLTQDNDAGAISDDSAGDRGSCRVVQGRDRTFLWRNGRVSFFS